LVIQGANALPRCYQATRYFIFFLLFFFSLLTLKNEQP
jgi:hypothetical protein